MRKVIQQDVNRDTPLKTNMHLGPTHVVPGARVGDGISGGFHFPIYTFRFSLNQRRPARANLVVRKKSGK